MRAFILRRVELIAHGLGDVVLVGSSHCAGTLRVKEFLTRNGHPYTYIDLDRDADVQELLDRFHVAAGDVPVLICRGDVRAAEPDQSADRRLPRLQRGDRPDARPRRGHRRRRAAGLAAAVYAASEGLDVLVLESNAPGGQAGSSSKIENYLGFPTGISGQELAGRAYTQAQKFGAQIDDRARRDAARRATRKPYAIEIDDGPRVPARSRHHRDRRRVPEARRSRTCRSSRARASTTARRSSRRSCAAAKRSIVVGGGNSAGQAAVFLAQTAKRVHMLVRVERAGRDHVALPDSAHRGEPRDRPAHAHGDRRRSKATAISSACAGATRQTGASRRATSGTSSS